LDRSGSSSSGYPVVAPRESISSGAKTVAEGCDERVPRASAQQAGGCAAPMTGIVRKLCVVEGQRVVRGDVMVVLEAMKMEHRLTAHAGSIVTAVRPVEGQMVDPDDVLVVIEPDPEAA
jgi:biotin carboxyl carrier protein